MKFTIIIPCYNSEKWIKECINSALNQTYQDLEIIFVDNESKDNSLKIAKEIQKDNPKLKIFTAPNLYPHSWSEPVEEALKNTTGDYFTILGSDDYLKDDYVEKIVGILKNKTDKIKLLQTPILGIKEDTGNSTGVIKHSYKSLDEFKEKLFVGCPVNTPSMVFSYELYEKGLLEWNSKEFFGAADYELYFNLANSNLFIYPFPNWIGYYYRWHGGQATWGMHKESVNYDLLIKEKWREIWKIR